MRVLVVEDDLKISSFLRRGLEAERHVVEVARSATDADRRAFGGSFDFILLDLMLPGPDGRELLVRLRQTGSKTPVIVITARSAVEDKVGVLDLGADDYLTKPFSFTELLARMRAVQRRRAGPEEAVVRQGPFVLDTIKRLASRDGVVIDLTPREHQLFEFFMRHHGETVSRAMLADRVWGIDFDTGSNVIDVYVNYLRKKLGGATPAIRTVRGVGYVFDAGAAGS